MNFASVAVIILAAGKGTRMQSDLPKVLHPVNGKSMVNRVVGCVSPVFDNIIVVIGHMSELVKAEVDREFKDNVSYAFQRMLLGTGDAVRSAIPCLHESIDHVLVLCGDVPLIQRATLTSFVKQHMETSQNISVLAVSIDEPKGYGRILLDENGRFLSICEEADATPEEKKINMVNSGIYSISKKFLVDSLALIGRDNVQKEYYLTDLISISCKTGGNAGYFMGTDPEEVMGVNTIDDLKRAEQVIESSDL